MARGKKKWRITNFGNTRKFPYKGQYIEISKNGSIETDNPEIAEAFGGYPYVDAVEIKSEAVNQTPVKKKKKQTKKKLTKKVKKKTSKTSGNRRKTKQKQKTKRRIK